MRYLLLSLLLLTSLARAELAETDWLELMPEADRQALEAMPEISHDSPEQDGAFYNPDGLRQQDKNLPAVMYSAKTVAALDGKAIRLGGYPVPLETDAQGMRSEWIEGRQASASSLALSHQTGCNCRGSMADAWRRPRTAPQQAQACAISAWTAAIFASRVARSAQRRVAWPTLRPTLKALP
ncbi:DUF3299 domain-containing protein [Pseudomonas sp.]|uniref:DUF3299 domain-containing protein n=1 Tax=Pseudomonas sp. TaxID=306 RepID=UPI00299E1358|nr:DUF3299 domain-containing protein [Pseudomonas sp.]MDX1370810.1 DUF3299 domain-containing protein [Pseudomonas sp.]